MTRKLLPTSAPKPIPPEFMEKFVQHGWRRVEHLFGKSTAAAWRKAIGAKRMAEARKRYLAERTGDNRLHSVAFRNAMARLRDEVGA